MEYGVCKSSRPQGFCDPPIHPVLHASRGMRLDNCALVSALASHGQEDKIVKNHPLPVSKSSKAVLSTAVEKVAGA